MCVAGIVWHGCVRVSRVSPAFVEEAVGRDVCPPSLTAGAPVVLLLAVAVEQDALLRSLPLLWVTSVGTTLTACYAVWRIALRIAALVAELLFCFGLGFLARDAVQLIT